MDFSFKKLVRLIVLIIGALVVAISIIVFYIVNNSSETEGVVDVVGCGVIDLQESEEVIRGKEIFSDTCLACHKLDAYSTGPGLRGTDYLVLKEWLKNLPKEKDKVEYGRMFHYETYNQVLKEEDIEALLSYLE
ncbi:MAG: cytochrome c [Flavobacteriaceae bacterium]|nr:cytochrome c [Flavobacteriaceae bacterium]